MRTLAIALVSAVFLMFGTDSSDARGPRGKQANNSPNGNCLLQQQPAAQRQNAAQPQNGQQLRRRDGSCGQQCQQGYGNTQCPRYGNSRGNGQGRGARWRGGA